MQVPPYDPAIGLEICAYRREGKALNAISSLLGLASPWVIEQWARANPDFAEMYRCANLDAADSISVAIVGVADGKDDGAMARRRILARKHRMEFLMMLHSASAPPRSDRREPITVNIHASHEDAGSEDNEDNEAAPS